MTLLANTEDPRLNPQEEQSDLVYSVYSARPRCYKTFFMLNSTEHEIFPPHKC